MLAQQVIEEMFKDLQLGSEAQRDKFRQLSSDGGAEFRLPTLHFIRVVSSSAPEQEVRGG